MDEDADLDDLDINADVEIINRKSGDTKAVIKCE